MIPELLAFDGLSTAGLRSEPVEDAGYSRAVTGESITGWELEDLLQTPVFYVDSYDGSGELVMMTEGGRMFDDHLGFYRLGVPRADNCAWDSSLFTCVFYSTDPGIAHITAGASVIAGDITLGQDASIIDPIARMERSGVARGAEVWKVEVDIGAVASAYGARVLSHAASNYLSGVACEGRDANSVAANSLFEAGVARVKSAGNCCHVAGECGNDEDCAGPSGGTTDCTVGSPGAAIGVFPIGAYQVDSADQEVMYGAQSRGGTGTEGRGRTIIGVAGPANIAFPYAWTDPLFDAVGAPYIYGTQRGAVPGPSTFGATSSSTPTVSGSAAVFRQWYLDAVDGHIDDPGALYANLLLMGDSYREGVGRSFVPPGFDGLWGAGKLRLRRWDGVGMDNPWGWGDGEVCVKPGESVEIPITTQLMDPDVEIIRVVAWWYDHRHDWGPANDRLALELLEGSTPAGPWTTVQSSYSTDNRQRVTLQGPTAGKAYAFRLVPVSVTSIFESCFGVGARIHYAWFYEDADREPSENLSTVRPETL